MLKFNSGDLETIKKAEQVIIKNLNTLDEENRSRLFSRLQSIKYKKIRGDIGSKYGLLIGVDAFYAPKEETVYIVDKKNRNNARLDILVHEMIHFITSKKTPAKNFTGFREAYITRYNNCLEVFHNNFCGINEGLTEFFTEDFLQARGMSGYVYELQTIKLLSEVCGKENFKKLYFNNDIDGFKELIREKYHLKNYVLIDKLFDYIDFNTNNTLNLNYYKQPIAKCIYETMLQMEINRRSYVTKKDVVLSDYEIKEYLSRFITYNNEDIIENIIKNKSNLYLKDKSIKEKDTRQQALTDIIVNAIEEKDEMMLFFCHRGLKNNALNILRNLNRTTSYFKNSQSVDNKDLFKRILSMISNKNGKINLDRYNKKEKYEFITNVLFSSNKNDEAYLNFFYPKDLIEYINNDLKEYKHFCNHKTMYYIFNDFDKVSPKVKEHDEFIREYNNLRYGTREIIK